MIETSWRIATDTKAYEAHDMTGAGAKATGGRWNSVGQAVVYSASSPALACLETLVHLNLTGLPLNRFLVRIDIPEAVWARREIFRPSDLPIGWEAIPEGRVSILHGDSWIKECRSAVMLVPSVISREDFNVLINPAHPDAGQIAAVKVRQWLYDPRMGAAR